MQYLSEQRQKISEHYLKDEKNALLPLIKNANLSSELREDIFDDAKALVDEVRKGYQPTLIEKFLSQYSLSTEEGIALMSLAEAMLRVPDAFTIDELISDKVGQGEWSKHKGHSDHILINSATWALLFTDKLINYSDNPNLTKQIKGLISKLGAPVIRKIVGLIMTELGHQFVLGRNINEAIKKSKGYTKKGYTYSFDMLGEAALTQASANYFYDSYLHAIRQLASQCSSNDTRKNPGISIKLSALHPRYEPLQKDRVIQELSPKVLELAKEAKKANMGFNIDAEESDRLDLSLDIIETVLSNDELKNWDGFGVVVQAYSKRASHVIDWLYQLATKFDRKIMIRLVKGAYWDAEIKHYQSLGVDGFPVYTCKEHTDVSYICCAKQLLGFTDRIYPQFATHNAHSIASILNLAQDPNVFEFQRLHGMGESLYEIVTQNTDYSCRIYAPCGEHKELLAYLVRRLLENGANSSFVNKIVDKSIEASAVVQDPFDLVRFGNLNWENNKILNPISLFKGQRFNSMGWDISDTTSIQELIEQRQKFDQDTWFAHSLICGATVDKSNSVIIANPANPTDILGSVSYSHKQDVEIAFDSACRGLKLWKNLAPRRKYEILLRYGELLEENTDLLFSLLAREAGKSMQDCIAEVREAVDFAYFYAEETLNIKGKDGRALGIVTCISPWNFPLAIFSGQILAALAAGNAVLAKPAETTNIIAFEAIKLLHEAGVPKETVQLLLGEGAIIGNELTISPKVNGICFTGSTDTAIRINQNMAKFLSPEAPLIAETGGLNAMLVDSTALPEQAVKDIIASAFQSAGQRCSALRVLYLQNDIADDFLEMLYQAMDELSIGDPLAFSTDIGPVIDKKSQTNLNEYIRIKRENGRVLKECNIPKSGNFVAPTVIEVNGIQDIEKEIFGPVLHIARFEAKIPI